MTRRSNASPEVEALFNEFQTIEQESGGILSFGARNLQTNDTFSFHGDRKVRTASVIKLPMLVHVALAVDEGSLSWEEKLTLTDTEKVGGSGILTKLTAGLEISLRDICTLMIVLSDNTATNMIIERLGVEPINARMRDLGFRQTTLFRKAYSPDTPQSKRFGLGVTTPNEILHLLTRLAGDLLGSAAICQDILSILEGQQYRNSIPRFLPSDWKYAGKTGGLDHVRNDVGLVTTPDGQRFALSLFCQEIPTVLWTPENPGELALAQLSRRLLSHWTGQPL